MDGEADDGREDLETGPEVSNTDVGDDGLVSLVWDIFTEHRKKPVLDLESALAGFAVQRQGLVQQSVARKSRGQIIDEIDLGLLRTEKQVEMGKLLEKKSDEEQTFGAKCARERKHTKEKPHTSREEYYSEKEDIEALFGSMGMDEKNFIASLDEREQKVRAGTKKREKKQTEKEVKDGIVSHARTAKRIFAEDVEVSRQAFSRFPVVGERKGKRIDRRKGKEKVKEKGRMDREDREDRELFGYMVDKEDRDRFIEDRKKEVAALAVQLDMSMASLEDDVRESRREVNDQRNLAYFH